MTAINATVPRNPASVYIPIKPKRSKPLPPRNVPDFANVLSTTHETTICHHGNLITQQINRAEVITEVDMHWKQ